MQLTTIEMTQAEAKAALAEWEGELAASRSEEDAAIVEGYRQLAKGRKLIRLSQTITAGGQDDGFKPRLAVAPVEAPVIYLSRDRDGDVAFTTSDRPNLGMRTKRVSRTCVRLSEVLPVADYGDLSRNHLAWGCLWKAMVPVVPPRFRRRGWKSCHVLFEAEWARHRPPAPIDPALIRYLRGDLWLVLGVWDLTDLERAVLMQRNG